MHGVFVNALGVTNHSGRAVLIAHLDALLDALGERCRFYVLVSAAETELRRHFVDRVIWCPAPAATSRWFVRAAWECLYLGREVKRCDVQLYFTPSGIAARGVSIPQVVYCMNPWPLVRAARSWRDEGKAWLQRFAYRDTVGRAAGLAYLSQFMQQAYRKNAGQAGRKEVIAYQPVAQRTDQVVAEKQPGCIVCVSGMAPHKNVETVLLAFKRVSHFTDAHLYLVGGWPDSGYACRIRTLVQQLGLEKQVTIEGHVSREALVMHYAKAQIFCLMSRCESFGIPAVEAQWYGTPVVSSNACAIPEVCGDGGVYHDPDDAIGVARSLALLLTDPNIWQDLSAKAHRNARRFSADACSAPLCKLFNDLLDSNDGKTGAA